ncbi:hypothetical protein [Enterobacter sp. KBR-315C3_2022]|uniref:hypothetical protein n=1 Tax=Enterobacter sp. KBR-315C3_2022 TaxID=3242494 RepID=UPI0035289C6C
MRETEDSACCELYMRVSSNYLPLTGHTRAGFRCGMVVRIRSTVDESGRWRASWQHAGVVLQAYRVFVAALISFLNIQISGEKTDANEPKDNWKMSSPHGYAIPADRAG